MRRIAIPVLAVLAMLGLVIPVSASAQPATDIRARLERLPGVHVVSEEKAPEGFRLFSLTITQPADHNNPSAGTFQQRLSLLHRDVRAPVVEYTSGYNVSISPNRGEVAKIVNGNQLAIEHRYFAPSVPKKTNWGRQLTITQAAADQHRITQVFRLLYRGSFLATGASKGGSVATYYRRFYPRDVQGTVPYVAPNDVINEVDEYNDFLDNVGPAACRQALTAAQRDALKRRAQLVRIVKDTAAKNKLTFGIVGGPDKALEVSVVDSFFAFWQYRGEPDCAKIPKPGAETAALYKFFDDTASPLNNSDQGLAPYVPYYFQASYQMGWPEPYENGISDLLRYPGFDQAPSFVPNSVRIPAFQHDAMLDVDNWVHNNANRMLFVYGERDPWSAEPFELGPSSRDSYRYFVPGGNHGSQIAQLPPAQAAKATATIRRWAGLPAKSTPAAATVPGLDANPMMLHRPPM